MKNHPNTNTNIIRFENIFRIRIRISLFGLNYSNIIRIPNYSLTSDNDDINDAKNDNHVINRPPARPDWSRLAPPAKHCHNSNTLKYEREQIEFKDSIKIESGYEID